MLPVSSVFKPHFSDFVCNIIYVHFILHLHIVLCRSVVQCDKMNKF